MNRNRLNHILRESGLCIDNVALLDWIQRRGWARVLFFRFLRLRFSPDILKNVLGRPGAPQETARLYSLAMSHLNVGDSYKTTSQGRTRLADKTLCELARAFDRPRLLDVGVSDGSASLGLLRCGAFGEIILADRFNRFFERRIPLGRIFLDSEGRLLGIKWLCLYINLAMDKARDTTGHTLIETANPRLRHEHGRGQIQYFDLCRSVLQPKAQLIKCANILNASYFSPAQLRAAADNLRRSVELGGSIVLSQNNAKYPGGEAVLVLRNTPEGLFKVQDINGHDAAPLFEALPSDASRVKEMP